MSGREEDDVQMIDVADSAYNNRHQIPRPDTAMEWDLDRLVASRFDCPPDSVQMRSIVRELELQDVEELLNDSASSGSSGEHDMANALEGVDLNSSPDGRNSTPVGGEGAAMEDPNQRKTSAGSINMNSPERNPILVALLELDEPPSPPRPLSPIDKHIKFRGRLFSDPLPSTSRGGPHERSMILGHRRHVVDHAFRMQHYAAERNRQAAFARFQMQQGMPVHPIQQSGGFAPNLQQSRGASVGRRPSAVPPGYPPPYQMMHPGYPVYIGSPQHVMRSNSFSHPGGGMVSMQYAPPYGYMTPGAPSYGYMAPDAPPYYAPRMQPPHPHPQQSAGGFVHPLQAMGGMVEMSPAANRRHSISRHGMQRSGSLNSVHQSPPVRKRSRKGDTPQDESNWFVPSTDPRVNPQQLGTLRMPATPEVYTIPDSPPPQEVPAGNSSCHPPPATPTPQTLPGHSVAPPVEMVNMGGGEETGEDRDLCLDEYFVNLGAPTSSWPPTSPAYQNTSYGGAIGMSPHNNFYSDGGYSSAPSPFTNLTPPLRGHESNTSGSLGFPPVHAETPATRRLSEEEIKERDRLGDEGVRILESMSPLPPVERKHGVFFASAASAPTVHTPPEDLQRPSTSSRGFHNDWEDGVFGGGLGDCAPYTPQGFSPSPFQ